MGEVALDCRSQIAEVKIFSAHPALKILLLQSDFLLLQFQHLFHPPHILLRIDAYGIERRLRHVNRTPFSRKRNCSSRSLRSSEDSGQRTN